MDRKTSLKFAVCALVVFGVGAACIPFISSLNPPKGAIAKWQIEIDASSVKPGELKEFDQGIYVYRRTAEQIAWLKTYQPVQTKQHILENSLSKNYGGNLRSKQKELFVFQIWKRRNKSYLRQSWSWWNCGELKYHPGTIKVSDENTFNGVIACAFEHEDLDFEGWGHFYDVAGIASDEYYIPLRVPPYEINWKGHIVVGPERD